MANILAKTANNAASRYKVYAGFALNGMGTVLLGPLLPKLEAAWNLNDGQAGALLAAMFFGMTAGTVLVLRDGRAAMIAGAVCSCGGVAAVAVLLQSRPGPAVTMVAALCVLCVYGFGLGQAITTLNLAAGADASARSSRLAFGNAAWSAGAILSPLLVALALRSHAVPVLLAGMSLFFPLVWIPVGRPADHVPRKATAAVSQTAFSVLMVFCVLMFFYGSVENSVSSWVATFVARDAHVRASVSPLSVASFWFGVASGRVLAGVTLRKLGERQSLLLLVAGAFGASLGLVFGQTMLSVTLWAAVCGIFIGPVFVPIVSGVLGRGASPHQTGLVLAMCGAGATVTPFLLGLVSQEVRSLREALALPVACLVCMFVIALLLVRDPQGERPALE